MFKKTWIKGIEKDIWRHTQDLDENVSDKSILECHKNENSW